MRRISEIYDAYERGDHITNSEVIALHKAFDEAAERLLPLGNRFVLSFREARQQEVRLFEICKARGLKVKQRGVK